MEGNVMINGVKLLKYTDLMEKVLNKQIEIASVKKEKNRDSVIFECDFISEELYEKKMFVNIDFLEQGRLDIKYRAVIDWGSCLDGENGLVVAGNLSKKYRFIKCFIKEEANCGEGNELFLVGEYDCLMRLGDQDLFEKAFTDITMIYCSTLSDCIDIEQKIFDKSGKDEKNLDEPDEINYNPNPFG